MKKIPSSLLSALLVITPLLAQDEPTTQPTNNDQAISKSRWEARLSGGNYAIALSSITSISKHQYLLDGAVVVTEVTIDSTGNSLARFYHLQPASPSRATDALTQRGQDLLNQAGRATTGATLHEMAQKNYPTTTHARTVEFRIMSSDELEALYLSAFNAWDQGQGRSFTGTNLGEAR